MKKITVAKIAFTFGVLYFVFMYVIKNEIPAQTYAAIWALFMVTFLLMKEPNIF